MTKYGIDNGTQILIYIGQKGAASIKEIMERFATEDPRKRRGKETGLKTNEESKRSRRTIIRTLDKLKEEGKIETPTKEQLAKYGIVKPDGKKKIDGRLKFLVLKESFDRASDLDEMIELLNKGDDIDTKMVLYELKRYDKRYFLYPSQLDKLVLKLDSKDDETIDNLLNILYNYIINKGTKPSDKDVFLKNLRSVLDRYQLGHIKYTMLRRHVIWLLGIYGDDKTIFRQLIRDLKAGKLSDFKNDYLVKFTANVIEKRWKHIFKLERTLRKKGDIETADILREIRDKAEENAYKPIEPDEPLETVFGSPVIKTQNKGIKGIKK